MTFTFYWVHHLWHHDQIARWHVSETFDIRVLTWLKQHYWHLVHHRPSVVYLYGGTVLLFYRDGTDTFGRIYTEISAAFCAKLRGESRWFSLSAIKRECEQALAEVPDRLDPIKVDISWQTIITTLAPQLSKAIALYRKWLMIGFVTLALIVSVWLGFGDHYLFAECVPHQYRYEDIVVVWNQMITAHHLEEYGKLWSPCLPEQTITELNRLLARFDLPLAREIWSDLDSAARYHPHGFFDHYEDFLAGIAFTLPPDYLHFPDRMDSDDSSMRYTRLSMTDDDQDVQTVLQQITKQASSLAALKVLVGRHHPMFLSLSLV